MARIARKKSGTGIYHIMIRGNNRQDIFQDDEDRNRFLSILKKTKEISQYELYGYCLMSNHVHLLLHENHEDLSQIMKRINTSYAYWYNQKYERSGYLFQDRFRSEPIEDDRGLLSVLRYIHQNPLKVKLANGVEEYAWSSYRAYTEPNREGLVDTVFVLDMLGSRRADAIVEYRQFMQTPEPVRYLDDADRKKTTDEDVRATLASLLGNQPVSVLNQIPKTDRDVILKKLKAMEGVSIRQIERVTGLGRNVVANA